MNAHFILHSGNLSSITPGMELKEVYFSSQAAFPECLLQNNPCASAVLWKHLNQSHHGQKHQALQRKVLIWKLETGSFTVGTWSTHSFRSTLFTLELFVCMPVSLAAQYTISIFDGSFYISFALTHILTHNLHIVNATQFFKIMKPT